MVNLRHRSKGGLSHSIFGFTAPRFNSTVAITYLAFTIMPSTPFCILSSGEFQTRNPSPCSTGLVTVAVATNTPFYVAAKSKPLQVAAAIRSPPKHSLHPDASSPILRLPISRIFCMPYLSQITITSILPFTAKVRVSSGG
jgi:hypothetical protein